MKAVSTRPRSDRGFSLIEIMVALLITMIVMASVFALLQRGQNSFNREPEVSDMNANARFGLDRISQDLAMAGFKTPGYMSIMWLDGGGVNPDELTVVYSDPDIPQVNPVKCTTNKQGKQTGNCGTIKTSSTLFIDPTTFDPPLDTSNQLALESAYEKGMVLSAIQLPSDSGPCSGINPAIVPFELTQDPKCTGAGCSQLNVNHNPGAGKYDINPPKGFDGDVDANCAVIGWFHVVQYRVNPPPPAENPALERRDLGLGEAWTPIGANIENLQVQYSQGLVENWVDEPNPTPRAVGTANPQADLATWVNQVRVTVTGRSESTNLEGATPGVFAAEDTHLRRSFSTTMSLRNQLGQLAQESLAYGVTGWN